MQSCGGNNGNVSLALLTLEDFSPMQQHSERKRSELKRCSCKFFVKSFCPDSLGGSVDLLQLPGSLAVSVSVCFERFEHSVKA